ncbi:VanZ family protein [Robiginitalea sp.]|uniref:VanZ family protein n=1 Tax=Robiginitalea sp. TaxID=1902411 RepID=UPI003C782AA3
MAENSRWTLLFFLWMGTLTILSLLPSDQLEVKTPPIPHLDKWVHFVFYTIGMTLGALFLRARCHQKKKMNFALPAMAVALVSYGMVIEVLQGISDTDRSAEWGDVWANILGIVFGAGISLLLFRKVRAFNWGD